MATKINEAKIISTCTARISTFGDYVDSKHPVIISGTQYKLAEVQAKYQACLDTRKALAAQRTATRAALRERNEADAARVEIEDGLESWVETTFGATSNAASDFGFVKKQTVISAATKANAAAKGKATREAKGGRGTAQATAPAAVPVTAAPIGGGPSK